MNIYSKLSEIEQTGMQAVLCVVIETKGSTPRHAGSKMIVYPDGRTDGTVGGGELESLCIDESKRLLETGNLETNTLNYRLVNPDQGDPGVCGGEVEVYLEVIGKKQSLILFGAGHVGNKLAFLAKWIGFEVVIIEDRDDLVKKANVSDEFKVFSNMDQFNQNHYKFPAGNLFVVMTTRSLEIDVINIPEVLKLNPRYLGVIGSKRRWIKTTELLIKNGILESDIEKIFSPIGLDLGSETPEEIAISIMAEILKQKNATSGESLNYFRRKTINVE